MTADRARLDGLAASMEGLLSFIGGGVAVLSFDMVEGSGVGEKMSAGARVCSAGSAGSSIVLTVTTGSGSGGGMTESLDLLEVVRSLAAPNLGCAGFFNSSLTGLSRPAAVFLGDMLTLLSPNTLRADVGTGAGISTVSGPGSVSAGISSEGFVDSAEVLRLNVKSVLPGVLVGLSRSRSASFRFAPVRREGAVASGSELVGEGGGSIECRRSSSLG